MGNTRDQVGKAGLFVAGGIFRTAFYVCVAVLIFWIGKSAYQFGYNVFNQQAVSPGAGQEVTVVIPEGSSTYDVAKILKSTTVWCSLHRRNFLHIRDRCRLELIC